MPSGVCKTSSRTFSYSGPSGIGGSDRKQNTAKAGARGVRIVALSICSHEQTQ